MTVAARARRVRSPLIWGGALLVVLILIVIAMLPQGGDLLGRLLGREDRTWAAMQDRGTWRVGLDPSFPPFEMLDAAGQPTGYDVELAQALAAAWGLEVEFVPMGYDSLPDALWAAKIDAIVSAYPYDERATRDMAFSAPYFDAGLRLAVRDGSPITSTERLDDLKLAVEWGSLGDMIGRRLQREGHTLELTPYDTPDAAVQALVDDPQIDALLIDNVALRQAQGRGAAIEGVGAPLESNPYVIALPLAAHTLQAQVAATLAQLQAEGELAALETRWFGPSP